MEEQIRIEVGILVPQDGMRRVPGVESLRVTERATYVPEQRPSTNNRIVIRYRLRRRQEPDEERRFHDVAWKIEGRQRLDLRRTFRCGIEPACGRLLDLLRKQFVRDPLLHVKRLGHEEFQRFVLRLPAEPR